MLSGYYKACYDYGRFLKNEQKYDEAKLILKKGFDNCQQFCCSEYIYLFLSTTNLDQLILDYNSISYILKIIMLDISFEKLGQSSLFYQMYYLIKHSSFKQIIENDFGKYAKELFGTLEKKPRTKQTNLSMKN